MKANEVPKSKFVYPDKLYARCNNNKTLDVSYAPQNMKAVEYTRTDAFIDKACEWLVGNMTDTDYIAANGSRIYKPDFIKAFKNAMKG